MFWCFLDFEACPVRGLLISRGVPCLRFDPSTSLVKLTTLLAQLTGKWVKPINEFQYLSVQHLQYTDEYDTVARDSDADIFRFYWRYIVHRLVYLDK